MGRVVRAVKVAEPPVVLGLPAMPRELAVGLCRRPGVDPDAWYPPYEDRVQDLELVVEAREQAARACEGCRVAVVCRDYANAVHEPWGVWGGESEIDRRAAIRGLDGGRDVA